MHYLRSGMPEADPDKDSCGRAVYIPGDISKGVRKAKEEQRGGQICSSLTQQGNPEKSACLSIVSNPR